MKKILFLTLLCSPFVLLAQSVKFTIRGAVKNMDQAKFAYLSTLSQQITISSPKIFIVVPIVNGKFEFKDTFDLEGKDYQNACVFINDRGNISKEELASKFKQLIWVVGRERNLRGIVLEDLNLEAESSDKMSVSAIVSGGILSKQRDELHKAYSTGNKNMLKFIKTYPDSPVSFDAVAEISQPVPVSQRERLESKWGSPLELYNALSQRLRSSKKGKELKRVIDQGDDKR